MALSGLSALVVHPHAAKYYHKSPLVQQSRVVAPSKRCLKLFDPGIGKEGIELNGGEGMTTMSSNHYSMVLIEKCGVSFS